MMRLVLVAMQILGVCAIASVSPAVAKDAPDFNSGWQFTRAAGEEAMPEAGSGWQFVDLPHTPAVEPRIVNDQWQGIAFYRKEFDAPEDWEGQVVLLRFEAAMRVAAVRVNGELVAEHWGGYLPFTVDLSANLNFGAANQIEVRLDNRDNPLIGPKPLSQLDFNTYGGLYRGASLMVRPPVYLSDEMLADRQAGGGLFVTYPEVSSERATVRLQADIQNSSAETVSTRIQHVLLNGDEVIATVDEELRIEPRGLGRSKLVIEVSDPSLWSPGSPNLYTLQTRVTDQSGNVDLTQRRIGIRTIAFSDDGQLLLNGEPTYLRGVNRHQEYPYVGYATSPQADYRDALLIKSAGFDYVRLSHYPHSTAFMEAADELGLLLLDAIPGWQFFNPDPRFSDQVVRTCEDMIRRDRNHPSVLAWECSLNETDMPTSLVDRLVQTVRDEYPGDQGYAAGWLPDGYDIYLQARQHRLTHYDPPVKPYVVSEYVDWEYYAQNAGLAQDRWGDLKEEERTSRQALSSGERRLLQQAFNIQESHNDNLRTPAFADSYWVMFDYSRGYADDLELSGIMSLERVAKSSYAFFRSQRAPDLTSPGREGEPMISIASYWTPDSNPRVTVFGNVEEAELFLNGQSIGRRVPTVDQFSDQLAFPPFHFNVGGFAPGEMRAVGYIDGKSVAEDIVRTPGEATTICYFFDDLGVEPVAGDVVFLRAIVTDAAGNRVTTSEAPVAFDVTGQTQIVGPTEATAEAGIASVLVRFNETKGGMPGVEIGSSDLQSIGACGPSEQRFSAVRVNPILTSPNNSKAAGNED